MNNQIKLHVTSLFFIAALGLMTTAPAQAQIFNEWTNGAGNSNFQDPGNWFLGQVPDINVDLNTANVLFQNSVDPVEVNFPVQVNQIKANTNTELFVNGNFQPFIANDLFVGALPTVGILTLANSQDFMFNNLFVAPQTNSVGELRLLGGGTAVQTFNFQMGLDENLNQIESDGFVLIESGARLTIESEAAFLSHEDSFRDIVVDGPGSVLESRGNTTIGNIDNPIANGSTTLAVFNGAEVNIGEHTPFGDPIFPASVSLGWGGNIVLDGGTFRAGRIDQFGGRMEIHSGTLRLYEDYIDINPLGILGSSVALGPNTFVDNRSLNEGGHSLNVGSDTSDPGELIVSSGAVVDTDNVNVFENGRLHLIGDNSLLNSPSVQFRGFNSFQNTGLLIVEAGGTLHTRNIQVDRGDIVLRPGGTLHAARNDPGDIDPLGFGFGLRLTSSNQERRYTQAGGVAIFDQFEVSMGAEVNVLGGEMTIAYGGDPMSSNPDDRGLRIQTGSFFNFSGGLIDTDYFNVNLQVSNEPSPFHWTGGTLIIRSQTVIDRQVGPNPGSSFIPSDLDLQPGMHLEVQDKLFFGKSDNTVFGDPLQLNVASDASLQANTLLIGDLTDGTFVNSVTENDVSRVSVGGTNALLVVQDLRVGGEADFDNGAGMMPTRRSGRLDILPGGLVSTQTLHIGLNQTVDLISQRQKGFVKLQGGTLELNELHIAEPFVDTMINPGNPTVTELGFFEFQSGHIRLLGDQTIQSDSGINQAIGDPISGITLTPNQVLEVEDHLNLQTPITLQGGTLKMGTLEGALFVNIQRGRLHFTESGFNVGDSGPFGNNLNLNIGQVVQTNQQAIVDPNGLLTLYGGTFESGFTDNFGEIHIANSASRLSGQIFNYGLLHGNGRVQGSFLNIEGAQVRVGNGERLLFDMPAADNDGHIDNLGGTLEFNGSLFNRPTGEIFARDAALRFNGGLFNDGLLATAFGNVDVFGNVENRTDGKVLVSGAGQAVFYDDVINNGEIRVSANGVAVFFGDLSGAGILTGPEGSIYIEGTLTPGNSPGALTIEAPLTLGDRSSVTLEIGGSDAGQFDQLLLGDVHLDGDLIIELLDGYTPRIGERFEILTFGEIIGAFDDITGEYIDQTLALVPVWTEHALELVATIPGDFNFDGQVDVQDLSTWAGGFSSGDVFQSGDANLDGQVDVRDLSTWSVNFGLVAEQVNALLVSSSGATAIPEPTALGLLALGSIGMSLRRKGLEARKRG